MSSTDLGARGSATAAALHLSATHPSLSDVTYETIRTWIMAGRLAPGSRLVERTLAADLGVSRIPVRDALRRLHEDGFVEISPRRGAVVVSPTVGYVMELHDVRIALEPLAARRAAERRTDQNLEAFTDIVASGHEAAVRADWTRAHELNWAFHETVVLSSGNPHLMALVPMFRHKLAWLDSMSSRERGVQAWKEHARIFDAIRAGDGDKAAEFSATHVARGQAVYAKRVKDPNALAHSLWTSTAARDPASRRPGDAVRPGAH